MEADPQPLNASPRREKDLQSFAFIATITLVMLVFALPALAQQRAVAKCDKDNGGITLSPGFCATVFADKLGHARHMAVAPNGIVYVKTWSGRYYGFDRLPPGGFLVAPEKRPGKTPIAV